jgi:DNA polymerase I-like protein with 3'-5' exonuclease and polymerase domains
MGNTLVLDLETTMDCPVGNNKANPMWIGNKIIAAGFMCVGASRVTTHYCSTGVDADIVLEEIDKASLVVGHNIKFDLLYIYRLTSNILPRIWDTQLAAYILSGQRHLYASLDELTAEYIGEHALKDDKIKEYWKAGVRTEDIPVAELDKYLRDDVLNTEAIFKKQWLEAEELGLIPLMMVQMDALRATIEMNRNGMYVDWVYVNKSCASYGKLIDRTAGIIKSLAGDLDYMSPKQLSLYFFGGQEKYVVRELVGEYKNGKPKYKNVEKINIIEGDYKPTTEIGKGGYYSVDDAVLKGLSSKGDLLAKQLLIMRNAKKIKETYYEGLNDLRFPDNNIYPNLNHCSTKTGRLSATNPNLQNQTDAGDVKRAYISRFPNGKILELDYSQLEMVALAYLADDKQLIEDINNGRDMHRELYNGMYGRYPTDAERKPFKRFSFLLVYGGGVTTLMAQSGCDRATAKKFISTFYTRYKGVKQYHESIVKEANDKAVISYEEGVSGPQYTYYHPSPTGRHYVFKKYASDYKAGELTFSPTELKNWPIQGFATGDVVPMMVGILLRKLEEAGLSRKALLVMTVHDSVLLDTEEDVCYDAACIAKDTLEKAPLYLKQYFNIDFPCQLKVGVDVGTTWQDKTALEIK